VINAWNSFPFTVDFSTLHSSKHSRERVDFSFLCACRTFYMYDMCVFNLFYLRAAVSVSCSESYYSTVIDLHVQCTCTISEQIKMRWYE